MGRARPDPVQSPHMDRERLKQALSALRQLGTTGVLGLVWTAVPGLFGLVLLAYLGRLSDWLLAQPHHGFWQWTAFVGVCTGIGLLAASANNMLCGWVFGWGLGILSAMTSYAVGMLIGFYIGRAVSRARIDALIERSEQARAVRTALLRSGRGRALLIVALFRLSGFPLPPGNLILSSCGVPAGLYCAGSLLGLLPRVAMSTFFTSRAAATGARDLQELVRTTRDPWMVLSGLLLMMVTLGLIGFIAQHALRRATRTPPA